MADKIDNLDTSIFDKIETQTTIGDCRSLLAVQRVIRKNSSHYSYLEIGSHLGGTIQPFLLDSRCIKIYSIDPRPLSQPDDRIPGYIAYYKGNSTQRMLQLLKATGYGKIDKIVCIEDDAANVDKGDILVRPYISLIDGEHTCRATVSDFNFIRSVVAPEGAVLFHDFNIVWKAIKSIINSLKNEGVNFCAIKLEDNMFVIFFDKKILQQDLYLFEMSKKNKYAFFEAQLRQNFFGRVLVFFYKKLCSIHL